MPRWRPCDCCLMVAPSQPKRHGPLGLLDSSGLRSALAIRDSKFRGKHFYPRDDVLCMAMSIGPAHSLLCGGGPSTLPILKLECQIALACHSSSSISALRWTLARQMICREAALRSRCTSSD
mmetsp:Transcript_24605/g.79544  ORF Transcript_24605/g.79544 Transcript_24605/m.79544 type:complete len:122 (-) Transcript_24605:814-1179(-)